MIGRPAIFFDRDGTLIHDAGYLDTPDGVQLLPGAAEAIRTCNDQGILAVVITNQSGVARGLFTEDTLAAIHARLAADLAASGARLDAIHYCPHFAGGVVEPYNRPCDCRKPGTALAEAAIAELGIDRARTAVIGDSPCDMELALNLGVPGILISREPHQTPAGMPGATAVVGEPLAAVLWLLANTWNRPKEKPE